MSDDNDNKIFQLISSINERLATIEADNRNSRESYSILSKHIENIERNINKLSSNVTALMEKGKQVDEAQKKIGELEDRLNIAEGNISGIQYRSESLLNKWEKHVNFAIQILIVIIGVVLAWKLGTISPQTSNEVTIQPSQTSTDL